MRSSVSVKFSLGLISSPIYFLKRIAGISTLTFKSETTQNVKNFQCRVSDKCERNVLALRRTSFNSRIHDVNRLNHIAICCWEAYSPNDLLVRGVKCNWWWFGATHRRQLHNICVHINKFVPCYALQSPLYRVAGLPHFTRIDFPLWPSYF